MKQIDGTVNLSDYLLKEIPSILNDVVIKGTLDISDNRIRNLNNFPLECDSVDLSDNPLTSLVGIKQKRMGILILNRTKIQNLEGCPELVSQLIIKNSPSFNSLKGTLKNITGDFGYITIAGTSLQTLEHCPKTNGDVNFYLPYNKLVSLVGMPSRCHHLNITENNLTTLIGCPQYITGDFNCKYNNLINFDGFPRMIEGDVFMTVSRMFGNPLMIQHGYFERELRQRCKIYGRIELLDPSDLQI